jgi:hypothetical protein
LSFGRTDESSLQSDTSLFLARECLVLIDVHSISAGLCEVVLLSELGWWRNFKQHQTVDAPVCRLIIFETWKWEFLRVCFSKILLLVHDAIILSRRFMSD